jgi:hypothetical protein
MRRGRAARALRLAVAGLLLAGACTDGGDDQPAPPPQPTTPVPVVDRSGIALAGVPGETTTTIAETGTAVISGAVQGPGGLIPGAIVRVERLVAGREIRTDVRSDADGRYVLGGVPGGRYRIRAFLPPSLVQLEPVIRFLADGEEHGIDLTMEQQGGLVVRADVAPEPPITGSAVNLVAVLTTRTVDGDGVVRASPVVGVTVELIGLGRWQLRTARPASSAPSSTSSSTPTSSSSSSTTSTTVRPSESAAARTDDAGRIRFELVCTTPGPPGLSLRIPVAAPPPADPSATTVVPTVTTETVALELPECVARPEAASTTTVAPPGTSSTTAP